jgi:hypothetical protein
MNRVTTANPLLRSPGNNNANVLNKLRSHYKMNELNNNTRAFLRHLLASGKKPGQIKFNFGYAKLMAAVNRYKRNKAKANARPVQNPLARPTSNNRSRANQNTPRRHGGILRALGPMSKLARALGGFR